MKRSYLMLSFILILAISKLQAQKFEMGKVTLAEIDEKEHVKDPSAAAAILFRKGTTRIEYLENEGWQVSTEVFTRIKIYKKEGYDWATHYIDYYLPVSFQEKVMYSDAITYNNVDGKIVKSKIKSDGEFTTKINKYYGRSKITLPAVKEGSVIEYSYKIVSPNITKLREWSFQQNIPVNYSEFKTYIPEYFTYNSNQRGFIFPKKTVEKVTKSIVFNNKERVTQNRITSTSYSTEKVSYEETQTKYILQDLPAMVEESYVNNIENYTSAISHELMQTRFPQIPLKSYATDWETVTNLIYKDDDFGGELNKTEYFENELKTVTAGLKTHSEIISAIFNYVKSAVKWNGINSYYCENGVKSAFKSKTGNVAEINLMLTAMLRSAGLNANPVLISTRSNGIALFPNRTAFNYVIAAVETNNGKFILLDATEKYATADVLPLRDLNWVGRLVRKNGTSEPIDLIPSVLSKDIIYVAMTINPDGTIDGKLRRQLSEHEALLFREKNISISTDSYLEGLENKYNNIEISDYKRENDLDLSKAVIESYSFKEAHGVDVINDKIYLAPLLFLTDKENPFKQDKREYPVDFGYPWQNKYSISIDIPDGYVVESMPVASTVITGDDLGSFKYNIGNSGNKIQVTISTEVNTPIISSEYYETIKEFFQKMIEKQNEKIVLIKKV